MAKTTKSPGTGTADGSNADELMAAAGMNPASQDAQDGGGTVTDNATGQEPAVEPETHLVEEELQPVATEPEPLPAIQPQNEPPAKIELPPPRQLATKAEPETLSEDDSPMYPGDAEGDSASELHAARLKKYGPDYVVVAKGNQRQTWSRVSWNMIRGDKGGWREISPIPAEVRKLNK